MGSRIRGFEIVEPLFEGDAGELTEVAGFSTGPHVHGFLVVEFSSLYEQDEEIARRALITNATSPEERVKRIRERYINCIIERRPPHNPPQEVQLGIVSEKFSWCIPHHEDKIPEWACRRRVCEGGLLPYPYARGFEEAIQPIGYVTEGVEPGALLAGFRKYFNELYLAWKKYLKEEKEHGELSPRLETDFFVPPIRRDEEYE